MLSKANARGPKTVLMNEGIVVVQGIHWQSSCTKSSYVIYTYENSFQKNV